MLPQNNVPHQRVYDRDDPRVQIIFGDLTGHLLSDYVVGAKLGKGSFGSVYEAYEQGTNQ